MARRIDHLEYAHRADGDADLVAVTDIMVYGYGRTMYPKLTRRLNGSPNLMPSMLPSDFKVLDEVLI